MDNQSYPYQLKTRILGKKGHLSNIAAAHVIEKLAQTGTKQIMLSHLSTENNTPDLAYSTICNYLQSKGIVEGKNIKIATTSIYPSYIFNIDWRLFSIQADCTNAILFRLRLFLFFRKNAQKTKAKSRLTKTHLHNHVLKLKNGARWFLIRTILMDCSYLVNMLHGALGTWADVLWFKAPPTLRGSCRQSRLKGCLTAFYFQKCQSI